MNQTASRRKPNQQNRWGWGYEPRTGPGTAGGAVRSSFQTTRDLLSQRAVQDGDSTTRGAALLVLAKHWPDQATRDLLFQRACEGADAYERGLACSLLGAMHSTLGRILMTRDLDGEGPYLDPIQPIPREHLEKAAAKAGIPGEQIDAQIASLSAHLGWDVSTGAKRTTE